MGSLRNKLRQNIATALGKVPAREGANGYVGDNPHEAQASKSPSSSTEANTGSSTQMKKKKATGTTGSGVNIV